MLFKIILKNGKNGERRSEKMFVKFKKLQFLTDKETAEWQEEDSVSAINKKIKVVKGVKEKLGFFTK